MLRFLLGIVCAVFLAGASTAAENVPAPLGKLPPQPVLRLMHGDDPRWAAPDWNDSDWPVSDLGSLPARAGIYWVRFRLTVPDIPIQYFPNIQRSWSPVIEGQPINAIVSSTACSSDLYWDGRLIWRNGVVGTDRASEKAGAIDMARELPGELLGPGEHVVAMRISTYHYNFPGKPRLALYIYLHNYDTDTVFRHSRTIFPLLAVGCGVVVAVLSGVLYWLLDKRRPLLLCGLLSVTVAVYHALASWRTLSLLLFLPTPYDLLNPLTYIVASSMGLIGFLIVAMFLDQFAAPRKWAWFGALAVSLAITWWALWDRDRIDGVAATYWLVLWECRAALAMTAVIAVWAAWRKKPGAWLVLGATVIGLAMVHMAVPQRTVLNGWFLVTFALLVAALFVAVGLQVRTARRASRNTELTAARMELELLKTSFQPHFLMNTLAVLSEVMEQDPAAAARLIDDLAAEFRTVARASAEKLITVAREIELCRTHLRVMSVRTGRTWTFEARDVDEAALVPPAVFLTLIENGFAHQKVSGQSAAFVLSAERADGGVMRYVFFSPGAVRADPARPAGGTGTRYVKARLEESFPGRWTLHGEAVEGGWRTKIELRGIAEI